MSGPVTVEIAGLSNQPAVLAELVADGVPAKIISRDASLWGPDAEAEAAVRLGWLDAVERARPLLPTLEALRADLAGEGVTQVVLCGMGGSSLAPEVICRSAGVALTVLDSTHPDQVRTALAGDLAATVVVVSSKSGGTLETDSQRRAFVTAFSAAGIDPARRIVVVTDPGSPFAGLARDEGYRAVFLADPHVGGRYSALTAFGLVPCALAGADVGRLCVDAAADARKQRDAARARDHAQDRGGVDERLSLACAACESVFQFRTRCTGQPVAV